MCPRGWCDPAKYIYLIGCFGVQYRCIFLRVLQYFDERAGRVKIQRTSKNF